MLYTGSIKDIDPSKYDEIWVIVRKLCNVKTGGNIYHVPQLAPSYDLVNRYLSWKDQGIWNKDQFDTVYTPQFLDEMKSPIAQQYLNLLRTKSKEKDILICCFCSDESMCHRSIVKQLVEEQEEFYLLVAGSRTFDNYDLLRNTLDVCLSKKTNKTIHVVSGGAKGADSLAERYAKERGYQLHVFKADWNTFGKSAGYRRNEQMHQFIAQYPDRGCVCFWDGSSKGTAHNFDLCKTYGTPIRIKRF